MSRAKRLEQLTRSVEHVAAGIARVAPDDREAFAELARALASMTAAAEELAK